MAEDLFEGFTEESEEDILQSIMDTMEELNTQDGFCLKVTFDLPPVRKVDHSILLKVIEDLLQRYKVKIPHDIRQELDQSPQYEAVFLAPAVEKGLRPRTVSINTTAEVRTLFIRGEPPIDGLDGRIEVHFDYSEKPGRLLPDGTIDFRNINRFPQVQAEECLISIFDPTMGTPGTDVEGLAIPPKEGRAFHVDGGDGVRIDKDFDQEEGRKVTHFIAERPGVVICTFEGGVQDAYHLRRIDIQNELRVRNIDFSTGNIGDAIEELRCIADVYVEEDIKGSFAVIIDGRLEVKGAVEGNKVDVSGDLCASLIRSSVKAGKKIKTGAALNASLKAGEGILIQREVTHCTLEAPLVVMQPKGAPAVLVGQCILKTNSVFLNRGEIRSSLEIQLGGDLFEAMELTQKREESIKKTLDILNGEMKDHFLIFSDKFKGIIHASGAVGKDQLQHLKEIGTGLIKDTLDANEGMERLREIAAKGELLLRPLIRSVKELIAIKAKREQLLAELEAIEAQKNGIDEQLSRMEIGLKGTMKRAGAIKILCGKQEIKLQADASKEETPLDLGLKYIVGQGLVPTATRESTH